MEKEKSMRMRTQLRHLTRINEMLIKCLSIIIENKLEGNEPIEFRKSSRPKCWIDICTEGEDEFVDIEACDNAVVPGAVVPIAVNSHEDGSDIEILKNAETVRAEEDQETKRRNRTRKI
ncbi:hypothetical protein QAD02_021618 [Eretmocerus hayati]|uniref:Uncharacterized protein n=1 Tax=Eretmocerus hayati TaxID=131215 RepID=A0ACC2PQE8_9HYME|nr:hypothetical protein QAD02_021618 [Eretmocerus hayati]